MPITYSHALFKEDRKLSTDKESKKILRISESVAPDTHVIVSEQSDRVQHNWTTCPLCARSDEQGKLKSKYSNTSQQCMLCSSV